jgi:hypothetical protein
MPSSPETYRVQSAAAALVIVTREQVTVAIMKIRRSTVGSLRIRDWYRSICASN